MSSPPRQQAVHLVVNPVSGAPGLSSTLARSHIEPLLQQQASAGASRSRVHVVQHETRAEGDGVRIGREVRRAVLEEARRGSTESGYTVRAILVGGDGTTHEFLNGLVVDEEEEKASEEARLVSRLQVQLAVVPTGTANALYAGLYPPQEGQGQSQDGDAHDEHSWRLRSVRAMLASLQEGGEAKEQDGSAESSSSGTASSALVPLTLLRTVVKDSIDTSSSQDKAQANTKTWIAHIITSHALHAAILRDSEALRASHPGIERFKMTAEKNAAVWVGGTLKLKPVQRPQRPEGSQAEDDAVNDDGGVSRYEPQRDNFTALTQGEGQEHTLEGPFLYLAALTTDRLEPHFVPAPFAKTATLAHAQALSPSKTHARPPHAVDVIAIRPSRSPAVSRSLEKLTTPSLQADGQPAWASEAAQGIRIEYALGPLGTITKAMYSGGQHVGLTYPSASPTSESKDATPSLKEETLEQRGQGDVVVEYLRCRGYEWEPAKGDEQASLTCIDGTVVSASRTTVDVLQDWADHVGVWR